MELRKGIVGNPLSQQGCKLLALKFKLRLTKLLSLRDSTLKQYMMYFEIIRVSRDEYIKRLSLVTALIRSFFVNVGY